MTKLDPCQTKRLRNSDLHLCTSECTNTNMKHNTEIVIKRHTDKLLNSCAGVLDHSFRTCYINKKT